MGLPPRGEMIVDVAWKQVLKCWKRGDGPPDTPVCSVIDFRYPLNLVLNAAAGKGDFERDATLGVQQILVAVKSYGSYIYVLCHLAEDVFSKTNAEHKRLEGELKKTDEEMKKCKAERDCLSEEMQKWDGEKTRLEAKVDDFTKEKDRLTVELDKSAKDLWEARTEVERNNDMLKSVSAQFPQLPGGSSLAEALDDLKGAVALSFEMGFELALAQVKVLYLDADERKFDVYKVVVDGQINEEEDPAGSGMGEALAEVI